MPDGKLHVLNTTAQPGQASPAGNRIAVANSGLVQKTPTIVRAIQGSPQASASTAAPTPTTPTTAVAVTPKTIQSKPQQILLRSGPGQITKQILIQNTPSGQQVLQVSSPALAQQLAAGKFTLATVNGQQVLIRNPNAGAPVPPLAPQVRTLSFI